MADIKEEHFVAALAEFNELGREDFLDKCGFGKSLSYFLEYKGQSYDSKAILGAAHGYAMPTEGPWNHKKFSGGATGAARVLRARGFYVCEDCIPKQNPNWTTNELILATEFYRKHKPSIPGKTSTALISLEI